MEAPATSQSRRLDTEYYVEGYATTFNDPYLMFECDGVKYYERIEAGALAGADLSDVIFQYDHNGMVFARNSNNTLGIEADANGLFIFADLGTTAQSRDLYEAIRGELVTKMSWAFHVADDYYDRATHTRSIKRVDKIFDVSAVSRPQNPGTDISARSFFDGEIEKERREALARRGKRIILLNNLGGYTK